MRRRVQGLPARRPPSAIADLRSGLCSVVTGTAPTLSADGRTLAYVARDSGEFALMIGPTTGLQSAVLRTTMRLDAPALTTDAARVTWQMMPRDDWEIYVADVADQGCATNGGSRARFSTTCCRVSLRAIESSQWSASRGIAVRTCTTSRQHHHPIRSQRPACSTTIRSARSRRSISGRPVRTARSC